MRRLGIKDDDDGDDDDDVDKDDGGDGHGGEDCNGDVPEQDHDDDDDVGEDDGDDEDGNCLKMNAEAMRRTITMLTTMRALMSMVMVMFIPPAHTIVVCKVSATCVSPAMGAMF